MKYVRLRSTTDFDKFVSAVKIPLVFGKNIIVPAHPINRDYTEYIIAYHEIPAIHKVAVNNVIEPSYSVNQRTDESGNVYTTISIQPDKERPSVAVWCDGKLHPYTGGVMENPAHIVAYLLQKYGEVDDAFNLLSGFELECERAGLQIKGIISTDRTLRSVLDDISASVGAIWSSAMSGFMRLYGTRGEDVGIIATQYNSTRLSMLCRADEIINSITVRFDYDYARNIPQRTLTVQCPASVERYGVVPKTIDAKWLTSFRDAYRIACTMLQSSAFPVWKYRIELDGVCKAGQAVRIVDENIAPKGDYIILDADTDVANKTTIATIAIQVVSDIQASVTSITQAIDITREREQVSILYEDGVATITIVDADGRPVEGAVVWIGNSGPMTTNSDGQVFVEITPGRYVIIVEADGYSRMEMEVVIG